MAQGRHQSGRYRRQYILHRKRAGQRCRDLFRDHVKSRGGCHQHQCNIDCDLAGDALPTASFTASPTNSASAFSITSIVAAGSDVLVSWMTGIGKINALQWTAAANDGGYVTDSFADIFTVTNTSNPTTNYLEIGAATNTPARYYRVRLVP
jgi:hypothetical protein